MRFLKTLKFWLLVKASKLAGIDDFSCDENWNLNKSDWYNCYYYEKSEVIGNIYENPELLSEVE